MREVEMVEGVDISPEEVNCPGWRTSLSKKRKSRPELPSSADTSPSSTSSSVSRRTPDPRSTARRLAAASRLPRLPRGQVRVIIRPRDGIDVKKMSLYAVTRALTTAARITEEACKQELLCPNPMQNIYVLTTPAVKNAEAYAKVHQIILGTKQHAIAAYVTAPENTCKGVVRNIDAHLTEIQLKDLFVTERNPSILEAKRIKASTTVVLLFEGMQVPRSRERKHQRLQSRDRSGGADDLNRQAGAGGLRSTLEGGARSPSNRGGSSNVDASSSRPQCRMRSRSGARRSCSSHRSQSRSLRGSSRSQSRRRSRSGRDRSSEQVRLQSPSWADRVQGGRKTPPTSSTNAQVTPRALPEHINNRIDEVLRENKEIKEQLDQLTHAITNMAEENMRLRAENASLKTERDQLQSQRAPTPPRSTKRRMSPCSRGAEGEDKLEAVMQALRRQSEDLNAIFQRMATMESTMAAHIPSNAAQSNGATGLPHSAICPNPNGPCNGQ
ncbi:hypothetical protein HPB48_019423 [Haemaphysalis longicornis]|uniref:Uncharacterized protein n=1 Tax=Haemaphysalis longicornis TaxID=44386 RepID=A0A9J6FXR0_HAELO|nr:hypothetical protein HPB48_019423 [Haemaphysalis longicornis]